MVRLRQVQEVVRGGLSFVQWRVLTLAVVLRWLFGGGRWLFGGGRWLFGGWRSCPMPCPPAFPLSILFHPLAMAFLPCRLQVFCYWGRVFGCSGVPGQD